MRIAFVSMETTRQADTVGARRFERIARLLDARGHEVTLFCQQWWDGESDEFEDDGLTHRAVTLGSSSSFALRLPTQLLRYRPDIIHVRATPPGQVMAALTASKLGRIPLVLEWAGDEMLDSSDRFLTTAVKRPTRVITPSELIRTEVRELGADGNRTIVIPESIDWSVLEAVSPKENGEIVYAHRLDETANLGDLLLGLAELRTRDWSATIIGDGPLREEYEQETADLRIDDRVEFVGEIDREERVSIYQGAHVFAQTARREEFPTELLWALACGCLGVVEYQAESSAHELIENYDRSFRVTNPQQIADAIAASGEYERRESDERWSEFTHGEVIQQYVSMYQKLLDERGMF